jgi:hypothetical protein
MTFHRLKTSYRPVCFIITSASEMDVKANALKIRESMQGSYYQAVERRHFSGAFERIIRARVLSCMIRKEEE